MSPVKKHCWPHPSAHQLVTTISHFNVDPWDFFPSWHKFLSTAIVGLLHFSEDRSIIFREAETRLLPNSQLHWDKLPLHFPEDGSTILREAETKLLPISQLHWDKLPRHFPEDRSTILREAKTKLSPNSQLHWDKLPIGYPHATQTGTTQQVLMSEESENSAIIYTASVFQLMFPHMNTATRNAYRIHYPTW